MGEDTSKGPSVITGRPRNGNRKAPLCHRRSLPRSLARSLARPAVRRARHVDYMYVRRAHTRQGRRGEQSGHARFSVRPRSRTGISIPYLAQRNVALYTVFHPRFSSASPEYDDIVFVVVSLHSPCTLSHPLDMHMHTWPPHPLHVPSVSLASSFRMNVERALTLAYRFLRSCFR